MINTSKIWTKDWGGFTGEKKKNSTTRNGECLGYPSFGHSGVGGEKTAKKKRAKQKTKHTKKKNQTTICFIWTEKKRVVIKNKEVGGGVLKKGRCFSAHLG